MKDQFLTEDAVKRKLQRFAEKVNQWTFSTHPYQLQAEEAIVILGLLSELDRLRKYIDFMENGPPSDDNTCKCLGLEHSFKCPKHPTNGGEIPF